MNRAHLLAATAFLALHGFSSAQDFNVDIDGSNGVPSAAFGGAAHQPGVWNSVIPAIGQTLTPLVDVAGAATGVTMRRTAGNGSPSAANHPGTNGDDGLLLDDAESQSPFTTWTISGLMRGGYTVTVYAWNPSSNETFTRVTVNGLVWVSGGAWTGGYAVGTTHSFHTVTIDSGGDIVITIERGNLSTSSRFNGVQIHRDGSGATPFCFGDGSGTACPCGNFGFPGRGCANSYNSNGVHLTADGQASIANDTFELTGWGMVFGTPALFFQGTSSIQGGNGSVFGDGLRCAGGTVMRLGSKFAGLGGSSSFPTGNDPSISVQGANAAGDVRTYQCWYRNVDASFCTPSTFNLSNGLRITWSP